jgi:hypothetical protein
VTTRRCHRNRRVVIPMQIGIQRTSSASQRRYAAYELFNPLGPDLRHWAPIYIRVTAERNQATARTRA